MGDPEDRRGRTSGPSPSARASDAAVQVELALDVRTTLGECPRWSVREQALYFVDIAACTLNRFDPATGMNTARRFDQPVGCFAFRRGGGFVLAAADGFALLDRFDGELRPFGAQVEAHRPHVRFNDGRADVEGRFWAGTMDTAKINRDGALYRLDADGQVTCMLDGALTCNGAAVSPDGRTFYFADTPTHAISAFDLDLEAGALSRRRLFHAFPHGRGRPDGASVDAEGCYWCALYAGARVVRLSPRGELLAEVAIPAENPTMIGFGGPDLRTAYVTTARPAAPGAGHQRYPDAGGVFSFTVDTPGLPEPEFAG